LLDTISKNHNLPLIKKFNF